MEVSLSSRIHNPQIVTISDPAATPFTPAGNAEIADLIGAVSDAALVAFQLPEAPEDMERDLDQESQAWLRIRRASQVLLHAPQSPPKCPAKPWMPEGRPPTRKELQISDDFYAFVSKTGLPLEGVWEKLACKTGNLSFTSLRNNLGLFGSKEETFIQANGTRWPPDLAPPEKIYSAISVLLRMNGEDHKGHDQGIAKDKFILLQKRIDKETLINDILDAHEVDPTLLAEASGAKLQKIIRIVAHHPKKIKSTEDILKFVHAMLELEPKATISCLLSNSGGEETNLAILLDMILRQGLLCIENQSFLPLMSFCSNFLDQLIQLGSPTCPMTVKDLMTSSPEPKQAMVEIPLVRKELNKTLERRHSTGTLITENSRPGFSPKNPTGTSELPILELAKVTGPSPPTSTLTPKESPKLPSLTASPVNSGRDKKDKFSFYLDKFDSSRNSSKDGFDGRTISKDEPKALSRSKPCTQTQDEGSCKEDERPQRKNIRRKTSMPDLHTKVAQAKTRVVAELPDDAGGSMSKQNPWSGSPESPGSPLSPGNPLSPGGRRNAKRRATVVVGRRRSIEGDPGSLAAAAKAVHRMTDAEWELSSGKLFWSAMPPQTITYAIGASLQPVGSRKLGTEIIRPAWRLLDKGNAVDCTIGKIGTKRLRLEMDFLLDQLNLTLQISKCENTEERMVVFDKVRLVMKHFQSMCGAESKLAQVAVLYGVTFIVQVLRTCAEQTEGGAELATATRDLSYILSPHFQQLFQRRPDPEVLRPTCPK